MRFLIELPPARPLPFIDDERSVFAKAGGHPEHLRILKNAGLVRANENGLRVSYCIVPSALKRFKALLDAI